MSASASDEMPFTLWPVADPAMKIEAPVLGQVYDHWRDIKGPRAMPSRADLNLAAIKHALPLLQLYEPMPDAEDFRIRLIGTALTAAFGRDETGKRLSESAFPLLNGPVLKTLLWMRGTKSPLRTAAPIQMKKEGQQSIEAIWLPLSQNAHDLSLVLGCTQITDEA